MVHGAPLLNTQHYKVGMKGKWSNREKGVAILPTARFSSYLKYAYGLLSTTVGRLTNMYIYIYIYMYVCVCVFVFLTICLNL